MATPIAKAPLSKGSSPKRGIMFLVLLLGITVTLFILNRTYEKRFSSISNHIWMAYEDQRSQEYTLNRIYKEIEAIKSLETKIDTLRKDRTNDSSYLMLVKRSLEQSKQSSSFKSLEEKLDALRKDRTNDSSYLMLVKRALEQSKKQIKAQESQIQDLIKQRKVDVMNAEYLPKYYREQVRMMVDQFTQEKTKMQAELTDIKALYNNTTQEIENLKKLFEDFKMSSTVNAKKEESQIMEMSEDIRSLQVLPSEKPETKVPRILERHFKKKAELMPVPSEDQKKVFPVKEMEKSVASIPIQETSLVEKPESAKEVVPVTNRTSKLTERNYHSRKQVNTRKGIEDKTKKDMVMYLEETPIAENVSMTVNMSGLESNTKKTESQPVSGEEVNVQRRGIRSVRRTPQAQPKEEDNKPATNISQEVKKDEMMNKTLSKSKEEEAEKPIVNEQSSASSNGSYQHVITLLNSLISESKVIMEKSSIQGIETMEATCKELEGIFDSSLKKRVRLPKATMWRFGLVKKNLGWLKDRASIPEQKLTRGLRKKIRSYAYWLSNRAGSLKESFEGMN